MFGDDGPVSRCSVFSLHGAFRRGGSVLGLCHTAIWQLQAKAGGRARRVLFVCSFTHVLPTFILCSRDPCDWISGHGNQRRPD
jgi:hypothetical protein